MLSNIFKKKTKLDLLNEQIRLVVKAMRDEDDQFWLGVFEKHLETGSSLEKRFANPNDISAFAREVESVFGGMGSFNDSYYSRQADAMKEALFAAIQAVLKECWAARGKPVHSIPNAEIFGVGTAVRLVSGAVISIGRDEVVQYAPDSRLTYKVMERIEDDIDGMPRYLVKADSHVWFARHEALVKT